MAKYTRPTKDTTFKEAISDQNDVLLFVQWKIIDIIIILIFGAIVLDEILHINDKYLAIKRRPDRYRLKYFSQFKRQRYTNNLKHENFYYSRSNRHGCR